MRNYMKNYIITSFLLILLINIKPFKAEYTVSAEEEQTLFIYKDIKTVKAYFEHLDIYTKNFPDIDSILPKDNIESTWFYKVEIVLQKPFTVAFDEVKINDDDSTLVFESKQPANNYLYWKATFIPYSETQTTVKIKIKVSMTRESASDIHFLAPIVGKKMVCSQMKDKLEEGMKEFINKTTQDLYKKN